MATVRGAPKVKKKSSASSSLPAFRPVQLATLVDKVPSGDDWLHEVKYDGYRCELSIAGSEARGYTRSGLDWSDDFRSILKAAAALNVRSALIDGEVVVLDEKGHSNFNALQAGLKSGNATLVYFAFDLLELNGESLLQASQLERKNRLAQIIGKGSSSIRFSQHIQGGGDRILETFCDAGLEGVVSKSAVAQYVGARTRAWLKTKCIARQEFAIVGWTSSDKARDFRSLVVAVNQDGRLRFAGKVGTGFDVAESRRLIARLTPLEQKTPTVDTPRSAVRGVHWVEPKLVAEIAFTEMTKDGVLRHPSYLGLREDKGPSAAVIERPRRGPVPGPSQSAVSISSRSRVLFPEAGVTKGQLADYYAAIADSMLPWVAERPVSIIRCPQGREKKCFFQKHDAGTFGDTVKHVAIKEKNGTSQPYLFVEGADGLLACVQMGTIEFHGWGSRIEDVEKPDRLVFDLDPDIGLGFKSAIDAAFDIRDSLKEIGLTTFPMLTGGKGVHVIAPLTPQAEWPAVRDFAQRFAMAVAQKAPERFTASLSKAKRTGRIFVDYLRNGRGATAVMPYSVRAKVNAPVATPVTWNELRGANSPAQWTVSDLKQLVRRAASKELQNWGRADQALPGL